MIQITIMTVLMMVGLMTIMAVGVIFSTKELRGSCGGPGSADCACDKAGKPRACEALDDLLAKKGIQQQQGEENGASSSRGEA